MVLLSIFTSTEFYVTIFVCAAAIVAFSAKPTSSGPVREILVPGVFTNGSRILQLPSLSMEVLPSGHIILMRNGLEDIHPATDDVSLAIQIKGTDINIIERIYMRHSDDDASDVRSTSCGVLFSIEDIRPGRYHIRYESPATQLGTTFTLHIHPGIKFEKQLSK